MQESNRTDEIKQIRFTATILSINNRTYKLEEGVPAQGTASLQLLQRHSRERHI